jgi:hypothetical protein
MTFKASLTSDQQTFSFHSLLQQSYTYLGRLLNLVRKEELNGYNNIASNNPLKRADLTAKNLNALNTMGGRARRPAGKKSSRESSTTTTADTDFGTKLRQNNIIYTTLDAQVADDAANIRELLDRRRGSEPPNQLAYERYLVLTEDYDNELSVKISAYPLL